MAIIGKMDEKTLRTVLAKKEQEKARATARREERERQTEERETAEASARRSCEFLGKPFAGLSEMDSQLRGEREVAERVAIRRRQDDGRWVSRQAQADAIAFADKLKRLGF